MPTLHWLTRDEDLKAAGRAAYRLLEPVPDLSAGEPDAENLLIRASARDLLIAACARHHGVGVETADDDFAPLLKL